MLSNYTKFELGAVFTYLNNIRRNVTWKIDSQRDVLPVLSSDLLGPISVMPVISFNLGLAFLMARPYPGLLFQNYKTVKRKKIPNLIYPCLQAFCSVAHVIFHLGIWHRIFAPSLALAAINHVRAIIIMPLTGWNGDDCLKQESMQQSAEGQDYIPFIIFYGLDFKEVGQNLADWIYSKKNV